MPQKKPTQCIKPDGSVGNDSGGSFSKPNVFTFSFDAGGYLLFGGGIQIGVFYDRSTGNYGGFYTIDLGAGLGGSAGFSFGSASNLSSFQGPTSTIGGGVGPVTATYVSQPESLTKSIGGSLGLGGNVMPPPLDLPASISASKSYTILFHPSLPPC